MLEVQGTLEGLHRLRPGERPFLMTRAGFASVQRFAGVWTGDNWSTWEHLEMSLPQLLNLGLSGIPFAGADIGGFFGNCEPELFARWMQLGAFYPFARSNSAKGTSRQEPWAFGPEVEAISRRAIEQRYRLIPYFETVLAEAARTGLPFLRPLFLHYPGEPATHRIHDQALVGRDLMIAPIVRPGQSARAVYLPAGIWYDTQTGQRMCGPRNVLVDAPLSSSISLFARGGSVVPSGPARQWTGEGRADTLTINVYPDEDGNAEGSIYEDDGVSLAYEQGESRITSFIYQTASGRLFVRSTGRFGSPVRSIRVRLHGPERELIVNVQADRPIWETEV
jgi:alpha-glucosidase